MLLEQFYKDKRILITGHTGFKGSWMIKTLTELGANVTGYALNPSQTEPNLFNICNLSEKINSVIGDIRDLEHLQKTFKRFKPEIVIHMAAQPLVRESYLKPVYTYEVNVMGTVNILECLRKNDSVKSFLNVTTDKVYLNREWEWGYRENEELNGFDPYSNSKSCSELVTSSYKKSFLGNGNIAISTARAGNVIGGGDFAVNRIIPDCIKSAKEGKQIAVRNPKSIRPYEHVLEPIYAYLLICCMQYNNISLADNYNVGPDEKDCWTTGDLVTLFCEKWNQATGESITWKNEHDGGPHEASFLKLDCSKIKHAIGWQPRWNIETAMEKIVEWTKLYYENGDVSACMSRQIKEFFQVIGIR